MGRPNPVTQFDPTTVLSAEDVVRTSLAAYYATCKEHAPPADYAESVAWSDTPGFVEHLAASIASRLVAQAVQRTHIPFGFAVGGFDVPNSQL